MLRGLAAGNRTFLGRVEALEARTLLNATIDVDAAGRLRFQTDLGVASAVRVSEVGGVYLVAVGADRRAHRRDRQRGRADRGGEAGTRSVSP